MTAKGSYFNCIKNIKNDFENKGYFLPNEKLNIPKKIEKILLLTSEKGAAIQDFIYALENNQSKLDYDIIDVPVQGNDCPKMIISELEKIEKEYDAIIITRGGGSFEDLFGFSKPELIESVHNLKLPVISAIGHQVDTCLLDLVADCCCPTPSLAAQYIIDVNKKFIYDMEVIREEIKENLLDCYHKQSRDINKCHDRINRIIISFDRIQQSYQSELMNQLHSYAFKLKELDIKLTSLVNIKEENLIIKDINETNIVNFDDFNNLLNKNEDFVIDWNGKKIVISNYQFSCV